MPRTFGFSCNSIPSGNDAHLERQEADNHRPVLVAVDKLAITLRAIFSHNDLSSALLHVDPTFLLWKSSHLQGHISLDLFDISPIFWSSTCCRLCGQFTRPYMRLNHNQSLSETAPLKPIFIISLFHHRRVKHNSNRGNTSTHLFTRLSSTLHHFLPLPSPSYQTMNRQREGCKLQHCVHIPKPHSFQFPCKLPSPPSPPI